MAQAFQHCECVVAAYISPSFNLIINTMSGVSSLRAIVGLNDLAFGKCLIAGYNAHLQRHLSSRHLGFSLNFSSLDLISLASFGSARLFT